MWLTWTVRPAENDRERPSRISAVSYERLRNIGSRLEVSDQSAVDAHQFVRFNVYNLGEQSVTVCAIALKSLSGERLTCELVPSLVIRPGARHPLMAEVTAGPVAKAADIQVEKVVGRKLWVSAQWLPRP
jgi:hypothetical protein